MIVSREAQSPQSTFPMDKITPTDAVILLSRVADKHGISIKALLGSARRVKHVKARAEAANELDKLGLIQEEIGVILNRERSSISNLLRRHPSPTWETDPAAPDQGKVSL